GHDRRRDGNRLFPSHLGRRARAASPRHQGRAQGRDGLGRDRARGQREAEADARDVLGVPRGRVAVLQENRRCEEALGCEARSSRPARGGGQQGRRLGKRLADDPGLRRLCRYAFLFRRPLHEVANWPAWHLDLLDEFRAKEPDLLERIELLLAQMTAFYVQTHKRENTPAAKVTDYLPCFDA